MSPVSSSKVSDPAGARIQVPFTLSDTWTCPGALYWANHPTSRSPWATGRVSGTVSAGTRDPVENAVPWTKVGVVDWASAERGSRTPTVAITASAAVDRADEKSFTDDSLLCDICSAPPRGRRGCHEALGHAARSVSSAIIALWCRPPHASEQEKCHEARCRIAKKRAQRSCEDAGRLVALADASG